jgi:hypothetical protein
MPPRDHPTQRELVGASDIEELARAQHLMPDMPLPVETLAGVCERMGWARQLAGNWSGASDDFRSAVDLWEEAEGLTRRDTRGANEAKLARLLDRRLKAQLQSDQPAFHRAALAGLPSLTLPATLRSNCGFLYNRSCLYAQASKVDPHADYQQRALHWLGLAVVCDPSLGDYAMQDLALSPIREDIRPLLSSLRSLISRSHPEYSEANAEALVARAIGHTSAHND